MLLGRVRERPVGVGKSVSKYRVSFVTSGDVISIPRENKDAPVGDGKTPEAEREVAPVEEEAELGREADDLLEMERGIAEVGLYKPEIKCVVGPDIAFVVLFPLLGLCGKIFATSPKFIES